MNKTNNHLSSHTIVNTKKGQQHGVGNPGPGLHDLWTMSFTKMTQCYNSIHCEVLSSMITIHWNGEKIILIEHVCYFDLV
jgi:hypothetical protein